MPAGCSARASSTAWGFAGGVVLGTLNRSTGPSVEFEASSTASGVSDLTVRSNIDLQCENTDRTTEMTATASITVVGPLTLDDPTVEPNPARVGEPIEANLTISGGLAPYRLSVYLGNGAGSTFTILQPGQVSIRSVAPNASFVPSFSVLDRQGTIRVFELGESEYVSSTFEVAIRPGAYAAEDGFPFHLSAEVLGGTPPYSYEWELTTRQIYFGPAIQPTFSGVTSVYIFLFVQDSTGARASALEVLQVVAPVRFAASFPINPADAGISIPLRCEIHDGVGPYQVHVDFPGYLGVDQFGFSANGSFYVNLVFALLGQIAGLVQLTDSNGVSVNATVGLLAIEPGPTATISGAVSEAPDTAELSVELSVIAGVPPFTWELDTRSFARGSDPTVGFLPIASNFGWLGSFPIEGNLTLHFGVIDSLGDQATVSWTGLAIPFLSVNLTLTIIGTPPNDSVSAEGIIAGGFPPYQFWFVDGGGAADEGNLSSPGKVAWFPTLVTGGLYTVWFRCLDARGNSAMVNSSRWIELPASTSENKSRPSVPTSSGLISLASAWILPATSILLALALVSGVVLILRRRATRRRNGLQDVAEDVEQVITRLLDESDGLDVDTLEFLLGEEGISQDLARATIERGMRERRWKTDEADDGTKVIRLESKASAEEGVDLQ